MAEIPPVIGGDTATAAWANLVSARTAQRYTNAAARDASIPAPVDGELAWLNAEEELTLYTGGAWSNVASDGSFLNSMSFGTPTSILNEDGSISANNGVAVSGVAPLVSKAPATGDVLVRWNSDGDTAAHRHFEWRRSAALGLLELWGVDSAGGEDIIFTITADGTDSGKRLNSYGFVGLQYLQVPAAGKDQYWFQMRNVAMVDTKLGNGEGIDGDIQMVYNTGASPGGVDVFVKVNGVWEGKA